MAEHRHDSDHAHDRHDDHHETGDFSTGQEVEPGSEERARRGDYAAGQQVGPGPARDALEGDYAEGQEEGQHERERERDDFARGQDHDTTVDDDTEE